MDPYILYSGAYRLLEHITPLPFDCGRLCGKACCDSGDQEDAGMYLFPREEVMYAVGRDKPAYGDIRIEPSAFTYGEGNKPALIAMCDGVCDRSLRPLACRIFPLVPYKRVGQRVQIIMDPRGRGMCPLARTMPAEELDERFVETVGYLFRVLCRNSEIARFIEDLSGLIDEYSII